MSSYGGRGPMLNGVLWSETLVAGIFVVSRCYTRHFILRSSGLDDLCLLLTLILLILYSAMITTGTFYGIGQKQADLAAMEHFIEAMKYEIIAQGFCIFNLVTAKAAVGFLLLRFAGHKWHRWVVWFCIGTNGIMATWCTIAVFIQCLPIEKTWNRLLPGNCWLDFTTVGIVTSAYAVAIDFILAIIPIFIVWDLNMKRKDKIITVVSLGLGIFAGVCGIMRTTALTSMSSFNEYIYDTVDMLIYSGTENFVLAVCASVPVLRPLYVKIVRGQLSGEGSSGKGSSYKMGTFGGSGDPDRSLGRDAEGGRRGQGLNTMIYAELVETRNHGSEEEILNKGGGQAANDQIRRQTEVSMEYSSGSGAPQTSFYHP